MKKMSEVLKRMLKLFRDASVGNYREKSEAISEMERELSNIDFSEKADRQNLHNDFSEISKDMRNAINQLSYNG